MKELQPLQKIKIRAVRTFLIATFFSLHLQFAAGQQTWEYEFTGNEQSLEVVPGKYKLEVWGAQGGDGYPGAPGGHGGYSVGIAEFTESKTLKIFVGEEGVSHGSGSYNGGGMAGANFGAEGGGATDIRTAPYNLEDRIIVAGGGGGSTFGTFPLPGGPGGGLIGGTGESGYSFYAGHGGSDNSGGAGGCCFGSTADGSFGQGAGTGSYHNAGGGGGWYGGGTGAGHAGAGGGSGYVGTLLEAEMIAGNEPMPNPLNPEQVIVGKQEHGFARITQLYDIVVLEINNASCPETEDGSISVLVSGGVPPYSFSWSNGVNVNLDSNIHTLENLASGSYELTVVDFEGNEVSASYYVGPDPIEIELLSTEASSCEEVSDGTATANVNGGTSPYSFMWSTGEETATISNLSIGSYSVTVSDANDCESVQESVIVSSSDNEPPLASVQNLQVYLDESGLASISAEDIDNASSDNCGIFEMNLNVSEFTCEDLNSELDPLEVTLSVTDFSGNSAESIALIALQDTLSPKALARDIILALDENGEAVIDVDDIDNGSSDNCAISIREISKTEFTCEDLGQNEITLTVTDPSGNESHTSATVFIIDENDPIVPDTLSGALYLDEEGIAHFDSAPFLASAQDNCGLNAIVVLAEAGYEDVDGIEFTCSDAGEVQGNLHVQDNSGNVSAFTLNLSIIDTIKPSLNLETIEVEIDSEGHAELSENDVMPYASDNCGVAEISVQQDLAGCGLIGENQSAMITVFDVHGNMLQKSIDVVVVDHLAPALSINEIEIVLNGEGRAFLNEDDLNSAIIENCELDEIIVETLEYSCENIGENLNTITISDINGNTSQTEFTVRVIDEMAPFIDAPGELRICAGQAVDYSNYSARDNCSATLRVVSGPEEGDILKEGRYRVDLLAEDIFGNQRSQYLDIIVSAPPRVNLGHDLEVEIGETVSLAAGFNLENTYIWSTGHTAPTISLQVLQDTTVSVDVYSPEGCISSDAINITAIDPLSTYEDNNEIEANFYPNPTSGNLNASFTLHRELNNVNISILDLSGKLVHQEHIQKVKNTQNLSFNLSHLSNGVYLINLQSADINLSRRIIKN